MYTQSVVIPCGKLSENLNIYISIFYFLHTILILRFYSIFPDMCDKVIQCCCCWCDDILININAMIFLSICYVIKFYFKQMELWFNFLWFIFDVFIFRMVGLALVFYFIFKLIFINLDADVQIDIAWFGVWKLLFTSSVKKQVVVIFLSAIL